MITVKVCGLTHPDDARAAVDLGADYLGFVFFPASRRRLLPTDASWIGEVRGTPRVGVFRDQSQRFVEEIREAAGLELVQLHGEEAPETCAELGGRERVIKAISVAGSPDWGRVAAYAAVSRILFDTASPAGGGTGRTFDWDALKGRPSDLGFWLAGGLTPTNVAAAIRAVRPAGVDVASGLEAVVGRKDPDRMRSFIAAVRSIAPARTDAAGGGGR